jgi:hypothetical protein
MCATLVILNDATLVILNDATLVILNEVKDLRLLFTILL